MYIFISFSRFIFYIVITYLFFIMEIFFITLDDLHSLEKRASSYLRFGKRDEILGTDEKKFWRKLLLFRYKKLQRFSSSDEINDVPLEKRPSSYVRFGKRPSSYVRFGKRSLIGIRGCT